MRKSRVRLSVPESQGLAAFGRAVAKVNAGRQPITVEIAGGKQPVANDEVVVIVLSPDGALASRTRLRGRAPDLRELRLRLVGAEIAVGQIAGEQSRAAPPLSAAEASVLDDAGLVEAADDAPGALERSRIELSLLLRDSLRLEDAAKALGVGTSRLRQRLAPGARTLYGIKDGRSWRIPRFQIVGGRLVRGIEQVIPHIRAGAHPLAVKAWFTSPHEDLVVGDRDERVTPLAWLAAGNPPEEVAVLAEEI